MSKLFNNTTSLNELLETIQNKAAGGSGTDTFDATATAATILSGYTAYVKGEKITGTIETKTSSNLTASGATVTVPAGYYASQATKSVSTATQATPSITVSSSGLITASSTQTAGYVTAGTKNATKQLTTKVATTYTPGTSNQTIAASTYLTGIQTIKGDSNLVASNIKSGTSIFGVTGTYKGSSSGGGLDINGIIEEYQVLAGENINAGDFVEFITNIYKALNSSSPGCYDSPSCVLLENNKVFIAHAYGSGYYLYGTIVTINGTAMTATSTQLYGSSYGCNYAPSCVLLENNKVFIAHSYSSGYFLYGTIVQINGTAMTAKSTQLNSATKSCYKSPSCVLLKNNKVFIAHAYDSTHRYLYGTIVTINGTAMTATSTQLYGSSYGCNYAPSCVLLENNKVFIAHSYGSGSYYLYGTIVQISGTTMSPTTTQLNSRTYSCRNSPSCVLLENNKVFIAHSYDSVSYYLYGTIVQISGTTMSPTTTQLNSTTYSCYDSPSCVLLENNKVFIAHSYSSGYFLYGTIVQINGTAMTATSTQLNSATKSCYKLPSCVLLENNKVFIAHAYSSNYYLYGTTFFNNTYAIPYNSTINGIAKTSGSGGEIVEIYRP